MGGRDHHTRAFVLQFHATTSPEMGRFEGQVEHVASGKAARFHCLEELLAFMRLHLIEAEKAQVEQP